MRNGFQNDISDPVEALAWGAAHDFNSLLTEIRGSAVMALHQTDADDPAYSYIFQIARCVDEGSEITNLLLEFAKVDDLYPQPLDLNSIIGEMINDPCYGTGEALLDVDIHHQPLWIAADMGKIHQAISEILKNALMAIPVDGMISINTEIIAIFNGSCDLYHLPPGEYATLTIADNGIGMDDRVLNSIFAPFYSADHEKHPHKKGIGLTLARAIISNHGGKIEAKSSPGAGATFSIYLPLIGHGEENENGCVTPVAEKKSVLVVDDEPVILDTIGMMCRELGYHVLTARNGTDGLSVFKENKDSIMLVTLDLNFGAGDGLGGAEIFHQIKAVDRKANVLIATGSPMNSKIKDMMENGCIGCLFKPFGFDAFSNILSEVAKKENMTPRDNINL